MSTERYNPKKIQANKGPELLDLRTIVNLEIQNLAFFETNR